MILFLKYAGLALAAASAIELFAVLVLCLIDVRSGRSTRTTLSNRLREHPRYGERFTYNDFDPIITTRFRCNSPAGERFTNAFGFTDNAAPVCPFPDKPPGVYRIALFGGSTAMGQGLAGGETIAGQLETILNKDGRFGTVQVLNFAISAAFSWSTLLRYLSEVTYYEPDVVIALEGWNEVVVSTLEHRRRGVDHATLNWSQAAYEYFDFWNGLPTLAVSSAKAPPLMTWTYILVDRLFSQRPDRSRARAAYTKNPVYNFSKAYAAKDPFFAAALASNLEAVGLHASARSRLFLAYLQPYTIRGKTATPEEIDRSENFLSTLCRELGWDRESLDDVFDHAFSAYANALADLQRRHSADPNFEAFDVRDVFKGISDPLFLDAIHYNAEGCRVIAERLARDISICRSNTEGSRPRDEMHAASASSA